MNKLYIWKDKKTIVEVDTIQEWGKWFESANREVAKTKINDIEISTMFLGLDHNFFNDNGPPVLFETMIFGGKHDQYQARYTSAEYARDGHIEAVKYVVKEINDQKQNVRKPNKDGDGDCDGDGY